ncbi:hypothetical protein U9M48_007522 [Paspalum notatum var. saurae]|uniref:X8 domain-containing protein n=1 Tax=Paspalum notatum var. saurae TaxID=547442 RepID=A0AAQ3PVK3_PASNO
MLQKERWQGCVVVLFAFLLCNASGVVIVPSENSPSEFAKMVQSKQTRQARVCGADPQLLSSLAGSAAEVMVTIPNEQLEHLAEFQEEADLWVAAHVARFLPSTRITHVVAGDDAPRARSPGTAAYFLLPAMLNLRAALAAAGLGGRVKVSTALSAGALADPAWSGAVAHALRFLRSAGSPLFLSSRTSEASDAEADAAFAAMRALRVSGVPVVAADLAAGGEVAAYYYGYPGGEQAGRRRSLATGTFCVALQNADPTALQAGLNWACGPGQADCSAIQPGGACYKQNDLPAIASYAYNEYYQEQASTGATCSFNGTATTTTTDPSSGSCVFAGSSMAGGSNSSAPPVGASPPTSLSPPTGFTPPVGSSPPSSDLTPPAFGTTPPPSGFTPPAGGGFGPPTGGFGPPGYYNGSGSFGPSGTLNPYNGGARGAVSRAGLAAMSAVAAAVLVATM